MTQAISFTICQLEDELREYDQLKSGNLRLPKIDRLAEIAPFIVKLRIAKGVSQSGLANRLEVSKQVISRFEKSDYQTVGIARLQDILDAIGVKTGRHDKRLSHAPRISRSAERS